MNFYDWLMTYIDEDSPIGDLARDAKSDSTFPKDLDSFEQLQSHIRLLNPINPALDSIEETFNLYQSQQN